MSESPGRPENTDPETLVDGSSPIDGGLDVEFSRLDRRALTSPVVLRAVGAIAVAVTVLSWPDRSTRVLASLIAVGLAVVAGTEIWSALRRPPRRLTLWPLTKFGVAVALVALPNPSNVVLGRVMGAVLVTGAARELVAAVRRTPPVSGRPPGPRSSTPVRAPVAGRIALAMARLSVGLLLVGFPVTALSVTVAIAAVGWICLSLVVIVVSLDPRTEGVSDYTSSLGLIADWLDRRPAAIENRQALYDKVFFEDARRWTRTVRFFALMSFASIIAALGVITDSTAVVIGAMLIAPLMTPLMGMAISLVMGWPRRLAASSALAVSGILWAIAIGLIVGLAAPGVIDASTNAQILSRSSPTPLDLVVAMAAGAAGAYGLSRPDVSDSLPGVAIAISLVPPLTVVGISYSQTAWAAGNGALLLFATNMVAILVVGGITFVATGLTPLARVAENQHRVATASAAVVAVGALVVGALLLNGRQITSDALERSLVEQVVQEWTSDEHTVVAVELDEGSIEVTIAGPSAGSPRAAALARTLSERLDRAVEVEVRLVVEERDRASATPRTD